MKRMIIAASMLCLLYGCATAPQPSPDLYYPSDLWDQGFQAQAERFARNWEAALAHEEILDSLRGRLLLGPGAGYRVIDGHEMMELMDGQFVLIRHTNGGDQNPDGTWNPGCFGSRIENRFGI